MSEPKSIKCPICGRLYHCGDDRLSLPCGSCWRMMTGEEKAPFIRVMRSTESPPLAHRDPVAYAPSTLRAYVEHLEGLVAGLEAS